MSAPQNSPERKKQKIRATRKLAQWRARQAEAQASSAKPASGNGAAKKTAVKA